MRDVAEVSGLSLQTVSRVANGEPNVNDATRERVLDVMRELGYRPNLAARAMRRGSFKTIGIVYQGLHAVGTRRTVESVSEHAAHAGYATTLMPIDAATRFSASGAFTRLEEMAVDVMVVIVTSAAELDSRLQVPRGVPVIVLGPQLSPEVSAITADIEVGESEALRYVLGLGHETVHHITGALDSFFARRREEVWREVLAAEGRRIPPPVEADWTAHSGYLAMKRLLDAPEWERPTAVFCANDQSALGAYRAIREAGLRIPEDVSVIGFDDIEEAVDFSPPLTTIAQDWDLLGQEMMRVAQEMLAGAPPQELLLPTRLVVRDSVAPPRR
ncbi:LacI family DNA-binding transcriptional regulator [Protaetiibacter sp. SSC-01]|uniref:LacI family DNA-binding transcriptional regulator n=1 Tax=Protaetiibacter sp. SSC-01 TaxID=2759943 RepID=UPI001656AAF1|nr:LacI family DNA-binding transcriptional regulator [Protaetiibacter sp. SSC-01]QNO37648.1 LacI family DNA-binding transcriptional regulator [Protaetiibacter sp. SSC-01]